MEGKQVPQELVTEVGLAFEDALGESEKVREEFYEDISIQQAFSIVLERRSDLRLEGLAHKVLQWYLCRMGSWFSVDAETISLRNWDQEVLLPGGHGLMVRGYVPVINTLAKGQDIRLNHRVTVSRHHQGVTVTVEDDSRFVADAAVIAVPLGVLKSKIIQFEPRLPSFLDVAENTYRCSYFLNLHKATGHPILVYMPAGKLARNIAKMSDEAAADFAFTQLKTILPDASMPIQYLVSHWGSDINSLGSYNYDMVGKSHDLYERHRFPVDNLFFAGEATSINFPGSVHGVYSTGLQAAEDCRMYVLERYGELDLLMPAMGGDGICVPILISRM